MNKKIRKFILKSLIINTLFINVSVNSLAGTLSSDTRYETFKDNNISITNILEDDTVDVEIEGNTFVNIIPEGTFTSLDNFTRAENNPILSNNTIKLTSRGTIDQTRFSPKINNAKIKPNTKYTFIFNVLENNLSGKMYLMYTNNDIWDVSYFPYQHSISGGKTGIFKYVVDSVEDLSACNCLFRTMIWNDSIEGETITLSVMMLEGDWSNKEVPNYFEGMKSVGQDDENGHKIEVLSNNKNLFDLSNYNKASQRNMLCKVKKGETYTLSLDYVKEFAGIDKRIQLATSITPNQTQTGEIENCYNFKDVKLLTVGERYSITVTSTIDGYLYMRSVLKDIQNCIDNIQLEKNNEMTPYTVSENNKKEILLNEPLKSLPNGIKDKVIKKNGQWVIERNIKKVVIGGNIIASNFIGNQFQNDETIAVDFFLEDRKISRTIIGNNPLLTDNFSIVNYEDIIYSNKLEGFFADGTYRNVYFRLRRDRINNHTLDDINNYFKKNPIVLLYELQNPIYEPIKTSLSIDLYKESTHITNDSNIPANMKITIDRAANRAQEAIQTAKTTPTTENLAIARMWINLMRESILKDEFQESANEIVQMEDLEIEKKKVSANLDLYVKTKNTLSLSLDTNCVTFDNYSGVEDMELLSAVNLTVNSSLPYSLNAYMEEGFYNSDKTNSLEVNSLNIRENTDTIYKQFTSIKEKVILKDNCDEGNEKYHTIDLKLNGNNAHKTDIYKTVIKFEIEQK